MEQHEGTPLKRHKSNNGTASSDDNERKDIPQAAVLLPNTEKNAAQSAADQKAQSVILPLLCYFFV